MKVDTVRVRRVIDVRWYRKRRCVIPKAKRPLRPIKAWRAIMVRIELRPFGDASRNEWEGWIGYSAAGGWEIRLGR